jgi:hypothetical protein
MKSARYPHYDTEFDGQELGKFIYKITKAESQMAVLHLGISDEGKSTDEIKNQWKMQAEGTCGADHKDSQSFPPKAKSESARSLPHVTIAKTKSNVSRREFTSKT